MLGSDSERSYDKSKEPVAQGLGIMTNPDYPLCTELFYDDLFLDSSTALAETASSATPLVFALETTLKQGGRYAHVALTVSRFANEITKGARSTSMPRRVDTPLRVPSSCPPPLQATIGVASIPGSNHIHSVDDDDDASSFTPSSPLSTSLPFSRPPYLPGPRTPTRRALANPPIPSQLRLQSHSTPCRRLTSGTCTSFSAGMNRLIEGVSTMTRRASVDWLRRQRGRGFGWMNDWWRMEVSIGMEMAGWTDGRDDRFSRRGTETVLSRGSSGVDAWIKRRKRPRWTAPRVRRLVLIIARDILVDGTLVLCRQQSTPHPDSARCGTVSLLCPTTISISTSNHLTTAFESPTSHCDDDAVLPECTNLSPSVGLFPPPRVHSPRPLRISVASPSLSPRAAGIVTPTFAPPTRLATSCPAAVDNYTLAPILASRGYYNTSLLPTHCPVSSDLHLNCHLPRVTAPRLVSELWLLYARRSALFVDGVTVTVTSHSASEDAASFLKRRRLLFDPHGKGTGRGMRTKRVEDLVPGSDVSYECEDLGSLGYVFVLGNVEVVAEGERGRHLLRRRHRRYARSSVSVHRSRLRCGRTRTSGHSSVGLPRISLSFRKATAYFLFQFCDVGLLGAGAGIQRQGDQTRCARVRLVLKFFFILLSTRSIARLLSPPLTAPHPHFDLRLVGARRLHCRP
ncbi:hypothetical protein R3P38DRAFT_3169714 [Favolaschia claudopus]|uniref:Uncharacterized protein n=1 Tax=Favolaschia claudopus TaxID=2862362 RepID=A0AAW0E1S1_9AGAR